MANKITKAIKQIRIKDLFAPIIFLILLIPSFVFRIINKIKGRKLWLVAEDGEARDNGYHFYKYVRIAHPADYCFYVIKRNSTSYEKVAKLGNVIKWGGLKHWLYYMSANLNLSSQKSGNPCPAFWYAMHVVFGLYRNRVFLQHGITKDDSEWLYYKKTKFKYFVCGAKREYDYILERFGYKEKSLLLTGFPRWDNLKDISKKQKNKSILIMPTWRNWLNQIDGTAAFKDSEFFLHWNGLLNDEDFLDYIEKNKIDVYFYPHVNVLRFIGSFQSKSKRVKIIKKCEDIQEYFNKCFLMITDYSSVAFDFAYLGKPVVYYQFDYDEFRKKQLQEGYYNYEKDGFGPVKKTKSKLVCEIIKMVDNNDTRKMNLFFDYRDNENSKRLYEDLSHSGKKVVLHVIYTLNNGGAQRYLVNLLKHTNDNYKNVVVYYDGDNAWKNELTDLNIPVIKLDGKNKERFRKIQSIIKSNRIDIVYSYSFYNSIYVLLAAKMFGVKKRIVHSHQSSASKSVNSVKAFFARVIISILATDKLACSNAAGKALYFGGNFKIINNGIELSDYVYDAERRMVLRKELKVSDDCLLLGTIGRLDDNKNQIFMIKIVEELKNKGVDCKLVIIGDGKNEAMLKKYIKDNSLENDVVMLGSTKKANEYYNAFDVFLLTSFSEGLPFVLIEAQANGLPILASSTISLESRINDNVKFLELSLSGKIWAEELLKRIRRVTPNKKIYEYSLKKSIDSILRIYGHGVGL